MWLVTTVLSIILLLAGIKVVGNSWEMWKDLKNGRFDWSDWIYAAGVLLGGVIMLSVAWWLW